MLQKKGFQLIVERRRFFLYAGESSVYRSRRESVEFMEINSLATFDELDWWAPIVLSSILLRNLFSSSIIKCPQTWQRNSSLVQSACQPVTVWSRVLVEESSIVSDSFVDKKTLDASTREHPFSMIDLCRFPSTSSTSSAISPITKLLILFQKCLRIINFCANSFFHWEQRI